MHNSPLCNFSLSVLVSFSIYYSYFLLLSDLNISFSQYIPLSIHSSLNVLSSQCPPVSISSPFNVNPQYLPLSISSSPNVLPSECFSLLMYFSLNVLSQSVPLSIYCTAHASSDVTSHRCLSVREKQLFCYMLSGPIRTVKTVTSGQIRVSKSQFFAQLLDT